jgi:polyisoprenyl-phosphate glycosyltransferase
MVSIWFFSGFIIFVLGMIGLYLGKTFDHVKNRPVYNIQETINV